MERGDPRDAFLKSLEAVASPEAARRHGARVACIQRPPPWGLDRGWSSVAFVVLGHFVYNIWFLEGSRPYWKGVNFCKGGEAAASKMFDDLVRAKSLNYRPRLWVDCLDLPPGLLAGNFDAFDAAAFDEDELEALRDQLDDKDAPMAQVAEDEPRLDDLEPSPEDITRAAAELSLAPAAQERSQSADRRQPWRGPSRVRGQAVLARERSDAASEAFRALVPAPEVRNAERPDAPAREVDAAVEQVSRVPYVAPFYVRVDLNGESTFFRIKQTTLMQKVVGALATRHGVPATSLCVAFRGARVDGLYTADMVGLCGGDTLDATIIAPEAAPAPAQPVAPPPVRDAGPQLPPSSLVPEPVDTASSSAARKRRPQDAAPRTPRKRARGDAGEDDIGWCMDQAGMSATTPTRSVLLMAPCPAVTGLEMLAQPATPGAGWEPFQALGFSFRGGGAR